MKISLPQVLTVKKIIKENYRTKSFIFEQKINAKPGQFVMIWSPGKAEKPFSITDLDPFTVTIMQVGDFTKYLNQEIKVGNRLWYRGPFGKGVYKNGKGKKVLIGGGCGCVPLYAFAKQLPKKDIKLITVILGAQSKRELFFEKKFRDLGFKVMVCTDDGSRGQKGFTTDALQDLYKSQKIDLVYSCGPEVMLKKIVEFCEKNKIEYQISLEKLMKCGFGICGSCSKNGKLVCHDGPVFNKWPK